MRIHTITLAATAALLLALPACGSSDEPDAAACKTAIAKQYKTAVTKGDDAPEGKRPGACNGVSAKALERLSGEVIKEYLDSPDAEKLVDDSIDDAVEEEADAAPEIPPACREWIETELLESAEDFEAGEDACGDLSEDEMNTAIDTVGEDLMDAGATPGS